MCYLTNTRYFKENGQSHEKADLSNYLFKDIDYSKINIPISFYRSDFSRSQFHGCTFSNNIFGRADFIDVYVVNTEFSSVDFGSCLIKNAFFEKTHLKNNNYHGVAMQYSLFKKCVFRDEHFITNMYRCEFQECTFINCEFEKSSLDNNIFSNCEFIKVDMSECIVENIKFNKCSLRDVFLCANLWTTYLYKDTDIYNFSFKYRGDIVDIWDGDIETFVNNLLKEGHYFEYLNSIIIGGIIPETGLLFELTKIMANLLETTPQIRKDTISKILEMFLFYYNYPKISFEDYLRIYDYLSNFEWECFPFDEMIGYRSILYKIKMTIEKFNCNLSYINTLSPTSLCVSKFHLNSNNSEKAIKYLENVFEIANRDIYNNSYNRPLITVISQEKGSIILTIASASTLTLMVSYVAKRVMHNMMSIQVERSIKKSIISRIEAPNSGIDELKNTIELAKKYHFLIENNDLNQIQKLSSEISKGEILDIIIGFLA